MLEDVKGEILACTFCAYCRRACPIYLVDEWEAFSPRGRVAQGLGLLKGELVPTQDFYRHLLNCSMCAYCEDACPSNIRVTEVIITSRGELLGAGVEVPKRVTSLLSNSRREIIAPERSEGLALIPGRFGGTKDVLRLLGSIGDVTVWDIPAISPFFFAGCRSELESAAQKISSLMSERGVETAAFIDPSELLAFKAILQGLNCVHYTELLLEAGFAPTNGGEQVAYLPSAHLERLGVTSADELVKEASDVSVELTGGGAEIGWLEEGILRKLVEGRMKEAGDLRIISASPEHSIPLQEAGTASIALHSLLSEMMRP